MFYVLYPFGIYLLTLPRNFLFTLLQDRPVHPVSDPLDTTGGVSYGVKRPELEPDNSCPYGSEVSKAWGLYVHSLITLPDVVVNATK
jgi:hypothetical protein